VVITVVDEKNKRLGFGKAIRGQEIPEFFETGKLNTVISNHFHVLKNIENTFDDEGELAEDYSDWATSTSDLQLTLKVTIIRITDHQSINFLSLRSGYFRLSRLPGPGENDEWSFDSDKSCSSLNIFALYPQMNTDYGRRLFQHCFPDEDARPCYEKINLSFRLVASDKEENNSDASLGFSGFSLATFVSENFGNVPDHIDDTHLYFDGLGRGVTFAHFLEAFDKWFIP